LRGIPLAMWVNGAIGRADGEKNPIKINEE
jgi:hypothetical protein